MKARLSLLCVLLLSACGEDPVTAGDSGTTAPADSGTATPVDAAIALDDAATTGDAAPTTGATVAGVVTRTGTPRVDGIGGLYIALFDMDPVVAMDSATVVGNAFIANADMSAAGASIPYEMTGVPPRAEPYYVIAFLDDNDSVTDPTMAAPDRGDLVSLDGFSAPQVTVATATRVTLDLVLNQNLPF